MDGSLLYTDSLPRFALLSAGRGIPDSQKRDVLARRQLKLEFHVGIFNACPNAKSQGIYIRVSMLQFLSWRHELGELGIKTRLGV